MTGAATAQPDPSEQLSDGWMDLPAGGPRILIAEDDPGVAVLLVKTLEGEGFEASAVGTAAAALEFLTRRPAHILVSDYRLPDLDGITLLDRVTSRDPHLAGILITGYGTVDVAVKAMKSGASDILIKPFEPDQILMAVRRARELQRLRHENGLLRQAVLKHAGIRLQTFRLENMDQPGVAASAPGETSDANSVEAAYRRGVTDGEQHALGQVRHRHEALCAQLSALIREVERVRASLYAAATDQITDLALAVASKIVRIAVDQDPGTVASQVREAIAHVQPCQGLIIRVHPDDVATLEDLRPSLLSMFEQPVTLKVEADPAISRGGCLLETPTRFVDATLETQLARVALALKRSTHEIDRPHPIA